MNIKVNNQYLDFNDDIEVERQVKLFEEAATTNGDFSYEFTIPSTGKNRDIFQLFSIDQSGKTIYSKIPAIIENNGTPVYVGYIKVERERGREIDVSFYSGNSNWFNELNFPLRDFDFSSFDDDWDIASINSNDANTSGIIFPVIDLGSIKERSNPCWHVDEMHPFIYVKSAIQRLLNRSGIKLTGDILQDWRYSRTITSNSDAASPQDEINNRSVYVNKSATQTITGVDIVTFNNESGDYYTGDLWNTGTDSFTADIRMTVNVSMTIAMDSGASNIANASIYKNGSLLSNKWNVVNTSDEVSANVTLILDAGDVINIRGVEVIASFDVDSATLKITPLRLHKVFTTYLLPDKQAKDWVAETFALFNPVINYNPLTKVLNVDLFKNVIRKPELDISEYIDPKTIESDYSELMENYGQSNVLLYEEAGTDLVETYNKGSVLPFGSGEILSENELSKDKVEILQSGYVAAMETDQNPFSTFLPKLSWRSLSETNKTDEGITATSSGGLLTFTASDYEVGDIVRISNAVGATTASESYNGEWMVSSATATTFRVVGPTYIENTTVDVVRMQVDFESVNEQALLLVLPGVNVSTFTNVSLMFYGEGGSIDSEGTVATAYFYKPTQGLTVDNYKQSLSFGPVNIPNAFQMTMIDSYWRDHENILKDPVKVFASARFPLSVFNQLFDGPLRLKTSKFNSLFYPNRITGYKAKHLPATIELIKIGT